MVTTPQRWLRRGLLAVAGLTALVATLAGLARLGLAVPVGPAHMLTHGPLFVLGVFTTVIALERAVAVGGRIALTVPALAAVAAVALIVVGPSPLAHGLTALAALGLLALDAMTVARHRALHTAMMLVGSCLLLLGCAAWALGAGVPQVVPAWIGFFVVTIVGERVELARMAPKAPGAHTALIGLTAMLVVAVVGRVLVVDATWAVGLLGLALLGMGSWVLSFDLARRTIRRPGFPRLSAIAILAGAGWLVIGGLVVLRYGLPPAGPIYDAALHAVLVGFVLSMVMAHAPIILPAVAVTTLRFHRGLYLPLLVLHGSVGLRIVGDLAPAPALRQAGAIGHAIALGLLVLTLAWSARLVTRPAAS